jgi:serine/threonine protein phosphatase PrpC
VTDTVVASARSDVGAVRAVNEDSFLARRPVFVVADGMGGHARGDKASQAAVHALAERLAPDASVTPDDVLDAIGQANHSVRSLSSAGDSGVAVAGTTLTGIVRVTTGTGDDSWMVINVGDSRVYGWDGRTLTQLSIDHSAVQELVDAGVLHPDEAEGHPDRNVITRALGADDEVDVDVWLIPAAGRQDFLICSDGLSKELTDEAIAAIVAETPLSACADALVSAAIEAGGRDNVTVIVVESLMGEAMNGDETTLDRHDSSRAALEDTRPRG